MAQLTFNQFETSLLKKKVLIYLKKEKRTETQLLKGSVYGRLIWISSPKKLNSVIYFNPVWRFFFFPF